jgi:hypothetical protein
MAESLAQLGRERLYGKICYLATTQPKEPQESIQ